MEVAELDWYNEQHRHDMASTGAFNFLLAADCIYNEEHVEAFIGICAGEIGKSIDIYVSSPLSDTRTTR